MKLQILVPHKDEDESVIKPLLDSLIVQQSVEMTDFGVVIAEDRPTPIDPEPLSDAFLNSYPYDIRRVYTQDGTGVSAARNAALDAATAEYVMFCDCDDMFLNACGLYILFREMAAGEFDALTSVFVEETRNPVTKDVLYVNHQMDSTFVHGKVYRRAYLKNHNIRFNPDLTIHEDSYFNCLAQRLCRELKYCQTPFYLWRWRDASVCRHDPKYILKTYNNMLDSSTALVQEFLRRKRRDDALFFATVMIYDAYFTMNKEEWLEQENQQYRTATEWRFKEYYTTFADLFKEIPLDIKQQIIISAKNRMFSEGLFLESITFDDWIAGVMAMQSPTDIDKTEV